MMDQLRGIVETKKQNIAKKIAAWDQNTDHYELYNVLGIEDASLMEREHYKMRVVAANVGRMMEEVVIATLLHKFPQAKPKHKVANIRSPSPSMYEIDCLIDNTAVEIKFRETTTDGDHAKKEENKLQTIIDYNLIPVRLIMYGTPTSKDLIEAYQQNDGLYLVGDEAWQWIQDQTGVDLRSVLKGF